MTRSIFHIFCYYLCWFVCIFAAHKNYLWLGFFVTIFLSTVQYYWQKKVGETQGLLFFILVITLTGLLVDTFFLKTGFIYFKANPFGANLSPPWMIALWSNFSIILYVFLKKYFLKFWLFFLASLVGFPAAYLSGINLGAAQLLHGDFSLLVITLTWSIVLPAILYLHAKVFSRIA